MLPQKTQSVCQSNHPEKEVHPRVNRSELQTTHIVGTFVSVHRTTHQQNPNKEEGEQPPRYSATFFSPFRV